MPILFNLISATLLLMSLNLLADCNEGDIIETSQNKVTKSEISDHVGFCQHHAARDLLHQEICKYAEGGNCFLPSVLEFLAIDAGNQQPSLLNNSDYALKQILLKKSISEEACFSINNFFNPKNNPQINFDSYNDKFKEAIHNVVINECVEDNQASSSSSCPNPTGTVLFIDYIAKCNDEILKNGARKFMYKAIAKYNKKNTCNKISIPNLKIMETPYNSNNHGSKDNLNKILKTGHPVKIVTTSPHALVIQNYRIVCRNGNSILEYQSLDSLYNTKWSSSRNAGDWIDGNTLISELNPDASFTWLESSLD